MSTANKYLILLLFSLSMYLPASAQKIKVQIDSPQGLKGRKAVLSTCERGFAATVHSVKLGYLPLELEIDPGLVPDLYQLHVSQVNGSLFFFLEPGTKIHLDTTDLSRSVVTNSKSNPEWELFQNSVVKPSSRKNSAFTVGETRARKSGNLDSLKFWSEQKALEHAEFLDKTEAFIRNNPKSFVSLYLLKNNWYAFQNKRILETLDLSLSHHRTYVALSGKQGSKLR